MRRILIPLAIVAVVVVVIVVSTLRTDPEHVKPDRGARPEAAVNIGEDPTMVGASTEQGVVLAEAAAAVVEEAERHAALEEAERLEAARRVPSAPAPSPRATTVGGGCAGELDCFLACTRAHESDTSGGYGAVSPGGTYRGAYQFAAGTWAGAVTRAGYPEYAGTPADQVPSYVQDAAAAQLYGEAGNQPWGGRC